MTRQFGVPFDSIYGQLGISIAHSIWRDHEFLTITTSAGASVTGTYSTTPRYYHIVYNPHATASVYVNFGATAAATSQIIPPGSSFQLGIVSGDVRIFSAT